MATYAPGRREHLAIAAWHDVTCPEGPECRSRDLHMLDRHMGPTLDQFLHRYVELVQADAAEWINSPENQFLVKLIATPPKRPDRVDTTERQS